MTNSDLSEPKPEGRRMQPRLALSAVVALVLAVVAVGWLQFGTSLIVAVRNPRIEVRSDTQGDRILISGGQRGRTDDVLVVKPGRYQIDVLARTTNDTVCSAVTDSLEKMDSVC